MKHLGSSSPREFCDIMQQAGAGRAFLAPDPGTGRLRVSHPVLTPLAEWLETTSPDYQAHEAIFVERGARSGALMGAFIHKTRRGQAQGGLRYWPYDTTFQFLSDGLRLARGMGRKNALAGLWWGGGKGVIARNPEANVEDEAFRELVYQEYGSFISSLNGLYVTAEDVGTRPEDMANVFRTTRFVTCVPKSVGGSGNPSPWTAKGVVCAMQAALECAGLGTLSGKRVCMQGVGNVGAHMVEELLAAGAREILATDISERHVLAARRRFRDQPVEVRQVDHTDTSILETPCDVLAPNALGGILNPDTIPRLQARVICGAANNQLLDERRDAELLEARGLLFVPDFVANRMGIVNCANEQYGRLLNDPSILRHFDTDWENSVYQVTKRVLGRARERGTTPSEAANQLADEAGLVEHPIWGHRSQRIIEDLIAHDWQRGA